jgi:hypothetical protein
LQILNGRAIDAEDISHSTPEDFRRFPIQPSYPRLFQYAAQNLVPQT